MPGPAAPEPVAAPSACSSARLSAPGVGFPAGGASAPSSSGQQEHSRESSCSEWRCRCSSSKKRSQSGKKRCGGLCSFPTHPSRLARSSASFSSVSSGAGEQESAMPSHAGGVALGVTIRILSVTAPLVLVLRVWAWGCGLCLLPNCLTRSMVVVLPSLLRVRGMTTELSVLGGGGGCCCCSHSPKVTTGR